jgi:hypothetical protein
MQLPNETAGGAYRIATVNRRTALRGTGIVALGAVLLLVSLPFQWVEPDVRPSDSGIIALLVPLALSGISLSVIAAARSAAWPFVYTRIVGACAGGDFLGSATRGRIREVRRAHCRDWRGDDGIGIVGGAEPRG